MFFTGLASISRMPKAQVRVQEAFIALLGEKDFKDVTVKDICQEADVNRKTFYDYYQDKQDIYDSLTLLLLTKLCGFFIYEKAFPVARGSEALPDDARAFLEFVNENAEVVMALLDPAYHEIWSPLLTKIVEGRKSALYIHDVRRTARQDIPTRLLTDSITAQMIIWLYWWLSQNEYSTDEGAEILTRLLSRSMATVFRYTESEGRRLSGSSYLQADVESGEALRPKDGRS